MIRYNSFVLLNLTLWILRTLKRPLMWYYVWYKQLMSLNNFGRINILMTMMMMMMMMFTKQIEEVIATIASVWCIYINMCVCVFRMVLIHVSSSCVDLWCLLIWNETSFSSRTMFVRPLFRSVWSLSLNNTEPNNWQTSSTMSLFIGAAHYTHLHIH